MELQSQDLQMINLTDFWKLDAESQNQIIDLEAKRRRELNGLRFYEPNERIEKFLFLVATTPATESISFILSAANGVGKTTFIVNLLGNLIFGPQNKFFNHPLFSAWPFPKRARYITTSKAVEEIGPFHSEIMRWWPKGHYEPLKCGKNYFSQYKANEWVIDVMTQEQDVKEFESGTLGIIIKDEPCPKPIHNASTLRLRMGGIDLTIMTPLTDAGWFFDEVVPRHQAHIVYADMESACKQHGVRGHLDHNVIEAMITEIDLDEREARVEGKAMYLKGLIYKTFNPQVHVLKETIVPPANATIYQAVDPHSEKPFAVVWAFVDGRGDVTIYDEWPNVDFYKWHNCQLTIKDYANIFRDKEQGITVYKRIIDRHFAEVSHLSGMTRKTLRDEFREIGIEFSPSYQAQREMDVGIEKVRDYLKYSPDRPIDILNKPKLFINPHCQNTIKSLMRWSRDPKTNDVQDAYKDFPDVVRYLVMDSPEVDRPAPYNPPVKRWG